MSILDIGKVCLFSETEGRVVQDGVPISGAIVKRSFTFQTKTTEEITSTDKNGKFKFGARFTRTLAIYFPIEGIITQNIDIEFNNQRYEAWNLVKRNYKENGELEGKRISLQCDLSKNQSSFNRVGRHQIYGICEWEK